MGQRRALTFLAAVGSPALIVAAILILLKSHAPSQPGPTSAPTTAPSVGNAVKIASITPAGTDLVIAMGAGDQLVGVSNYDAERSDTVGKPRIGDYQNIDWEKLSGLGANVLLLQYAADRLPAFISQRCGEMGIKIVNLKLDTIDEICQAMGQIGAAIDEPGKAQRAADDLRAKLGAVSASVAGLPATKAIIVTSETGFSLAGPGEFLSEILHIAGGTNAADSLGQPYPEVDREMITSLGPEVVIRLAPGGDTKPQVVEQGDRIWNGMTDVPAVRNHRVYVVTSPYAELPASHVGELAEQFAKLLHPELNVATRSAGQP